MTYTRCPGWGQESCGAQIIIGHPCMDTLCPQRRVTAEQYQVLERERDALLTKLRRARVLSEAILGE